MNRGTDVGLLMEKAVLRHRKQRRQWACAGPDLARLMAVAILIAQPLTASAIAQETSAGWYGPEYRRCADRTTAVIERCLGESLAGWERRLDDAYRALLGSLETPERRRHLERAQRLWRDYRDANCRFYREGPGSIARIEASECLRALTASRALELEQETKP
jgi:uncharacterized protein YecT (DUF1311 family)